MNLFRPAILSCVLLLMFNNNSNAEEEQLSCPALIEIIKTSDCLKPVAPLLEGAFLKVGLAVQGLSMNIETKDKVVKASMNSSGSLVPYYSLGLKNQFFGSSGFGYGFGITYLDAYALEQTITRNKEQVNIDLGTYVTTSMYAIQPSMFYTYGARNSTPNTYLMAGLGVTLGYSKVRGISYLTENESTVSAACWAAGNDLVQGQNSAVATIAAECSQERYRDSGWGTGGRVFLAGRMNSFMFGFNATNMLIASKQDFLNPVKVSLTLSYVKDL